MSDIEDEVKCSECPNASHGFDRNASHNEGRYVCQCESHKCPAESLRQQLAEKDAEIERLSRLNSSYSNLTKAQEGQLTALRNRLYELKGADKTLDSERDANAILTEQLAASQAREQQLREAIRDVCCDPDGNVCIGLMGGCYADKEVLEEALALPQDTAALEAMIAKAGEVMRERCRKVAFDMAYADSMAVDVSQTIRALPGVTLEDLK